MKKLRLLLVAVAVFALSSCSEYSYEKVSGDPLATRIYTLDNGLKVYLSVNKEQPRIQTIISVRVGAKNDPAETTGLAHYFEHLMFKGTDKFGTSDYAAEKPLLDQIEALFEQYRVTTDERQRKAIYSQIDELSQQASKLSIPNGESIKKLTMAQLPLLKTNGQGCFNDMDMLVVGMSGKGNVGLGGCTVEEYRTHFSVWAFFGSPLMIGCDIRTMDEDTKSILMNKEVLAVNQDPAYRQPFEINTVHWGAELAWSVWARFMENGDIALGFFNLSDNATNPCLAMADIGLGGRSGKALKIRDLWAGEDLGVFKDQFVASVPAHGCRMFRGQVVDA